MVLRAALPAVVGEFVIVPLDDHRLQRVELLKIGIGCDSWRSAADNRRGGSARRPARARARRRRPWRRGNRRGHIRRDSRRDGSARSRSSRCGGMGIGVEIAERHVRAGKDRRAEAAAHRPRAASGCGRPARSCRRARRSENDRCVPGARPVDGDLGGMIAPRPGDLSAARRRSARNPASRRSRREARPRRRRRGRSASTAASNRWPARRWRRRG